MLLGRGIRPYIYFVKTFESEAGLKDRALNPSACVLETGGTGVQVHGVRPLGL